MSVPRNPTICSVRHMAAKRSPTRVLPTKLHCYSFDTCSSKARLCAANENNVTRRPGKPFYGRPREDLQFPSRGPLIASIRRWIAELISVFTQLISEICAMLSSLKEKTDCNKKKKKLEGNWKIFKKREGRKREFIINCIYL